jgi:tRNA(Ile)-lysidine synthase
LLKERFPSASATIARSAFHCAEAQALLEEFALELCSTCKGKSDTSLSVLKLRQLSSEKQRLVLRQWIQQLKFPLPNSKKLKSIQLNVLTAAWDSLPCISWGGVELRRYRDDLYLLPALKDHDHQQIYAWDLIKPLNLIGVGELQAAQVIGKGIRTDLAPISVRFRQGGEITDVPGRGRHTLKNLFQEWNVLPWERNRIPLIFAQDQLIGVVGYFISTEFAAKPGDMGHEIWLEK